MTNRRNGFWVSGRACCFGWPSCDLFILDFIRRCGEKLGGLGDAAAEAQRHDDAITHYSVALSLNPAVRQDILIKRSKVYVTKGLWEEALDDTNEVRDSVFWKSDLTDEKSLGNDARSVVSMEPRERIDGVGQSKINKWVVEKRFD